jgi:IMP dehydrogenase
LRKGLSYDDVLLQPQKSNVTSLSNVDTSIEIAGIRLEVPVLSAAMDTVTEKEMAVELSKQGGLGVIHRFMTAEEQVSEVRDVKSSGQKAAAALGLGDQDRAEKMVEAGVDMLVLDIAHGHHEVMLEEVREYKKSFDVPVVAGNVATPKAAKDFENAGADVVKVGIGPGSACTTRKMTGVGVPQFTAVKECAEAVDIPVIADGGIRKPGDLAKALMAGADAGMIGGMFAGTDPTPGEVVDIDGEKYKEYRGMSSREAAEERAEKQDRELSYSETFSEGVSTKTEYKGSLKPVMRDLEGGLSSSISYCGADKLEEARKNAEFVKVTNSTQYRNGSHIE